MIPTQNSNNTKQKRHWHSSFGPQKKGGEVSFFRIATPTPPLELPLIPPPLILAPPASPPPLIDHVPEEVDNRYATWVLGWISMLI